MRKFIIVSTAAALSLGLSACQSKKADQVEDAADNRADAIDKAADQAPTEVQEDALHNKADAVREAGENAADAIDNGTATNAM